MRELTALKQVVDGQDNLAQRVSDAEVMIDLASEAGDAASLAEAQQEVEALELALANA